MYDLSPSDRARVARLQQEFAKPETLKRLFAAIAPALERDRRTLVYVLAQGDRIGHAVMEPWFLANLHGDYERIVLLTGRLDRPGGNGWVRHVPDGRFRLVETDDDTLPLMGYLDGGLATLGPIDLLLASPQKLIRDFGLHVRSGAAIRYFPLSPEIADRGHGFFAARGWNDGSPTAFLHVRDKGFRADLSHHDFRCADLAAYRPAIDRLVDMGYRVIRLGDRSSPPLEHPSDRVVDLPRLAGYEPWLDLHVAATCAFAINQASGPEALVRAYGRPALTANLVYEHLRLPLADDILLFKPYLETATGRPLRYAEILDRDLPTLGRGQDFRERGVTVGTNSSEQLLEAVEERLSGSGSGSRVGDAASRRFRSIGADYEARIAAEPSWRREHLDFYAHAGPNGGLSAAVLSAQPDYLD